MVDARDMIQGTDDAEEQAHLRGEHHGGYFKLLSPAMDRAAGPRLGMNLSRLPPGRVLVPFHSHTLEDEIFYILGGEGVFRYGDSIAPVKAGDCISCPAGTGVAHQLANTGDEDMTYLAVGRSEPNEVCVYPDSGKVLVRALKTVGRLQERDYHDGEPDVPLVFAMAHRDAG